MKTLAILWTMLAGSGLLSAAVVPNADFENGLTGWTVFGSVTPTPVPGGGPDGSACAQLEIASGTDNGIRSDLFPIEPEIYDTGYDLSVDIMRNGLGDWAAVSVVMEFYDAAGTLIGYDIPFSGLNGTVGWQTFTQHYDSLPPGTAQGRIVLRLEYGGWYCRFDKVAFGATLNQASLQALLDNGGTVTLPKGNFSIDAPVYFLRAGTTLTGSKDSVIRFSPGASIWGLTVQAADCTIRGITVRGNWDTDPPNYGTSGILIASAGRGCRIQDVTVTNQTGAAIRLDGASNVRIEGCTVEQFANNGILLQTVSGEGCSDVVIAGCQISGSATTAQNCIFAMGVGGAVGVRNLTITSNICRGPCDWGIEVGGQFDGYHSSVIITNNIVTGTSQAGIGLRSVNDAVVSGNEVRDCGHGGDVSHYQSDGITCTGDTKMCRGLTICNNSVTLRDLTGPYGNIGIHITNYEKVLIANNSVDTAYFGIYLEGETGRTFNHCMVQGNAISNTVQAIKLYGQTGYQHVHVRGNTIRNCASVGIMCHSEGSLGKFIIVTNNQIEDCLNDHAIEFYMVQKSRVNYNYMMNCPSGVTISGCTDVTQTGNVSFNP